MHAYTMIFFALACFHVGVISKTFQRRYGNNFDKNKNSIIPRITAPSDTGSVPVQQLKIVAGENYSDRGTSLLTVILVVVHEDFDPFTLLADLAIIRFYEDVIFKSSIKSISLIMPHKPLFDSKAFVTGWGRCDLTNKELCLPRSSDWFPDERMDPMLRTVSFSISRKNFYCEGYNQVDSTEYYVIS
ncbi:trypsin epsilon-like [Nymphalis io]|uniref:trypsin epsilon-like n=1 Tax=Inachis io TaxID=171585 RepID=UPI00216959DB|nr:trypsin epsilon-like [Nymphalis io]